ncbi:MAG: hypothetical protein ACLVJ6_16385 [Merdibacter sp.]
MHIAAVHSIGAPSVHNSIVSEGIAIGILAIPNVHIYGGHGAVGEDHVGGGSTGTQIAIVLFEASDEQILIGILVLLQADQVAVGIQNQVIGDVLQVDGAVAVGVLVQNGLIVLENISGIILSTVGDDIVNATGNIFIIVRKVVRSRRP